MRNNGAMAKRRRSPIRVLFTVLALALVVALAWLAWVHVGSNLWAARRTAEALDQAQRAVDQRTPDVAHESELPLPKADEPMWILEIPSLDLRVPVIAGTSRDDLSRGVGWYPTTALPGERGNVGIAGHSATHGKPFAHLRELVVGDEILLTTRLGTYHYEVRVVPAELTVGSADGWVLDPVPGQDFEAHESLLTLTTDQDPVRTDDRSVAFAVLTHKEPS